MTQKRPHKAVAAKKQKPRLDVLARLTVVMSLAQAELDRESIIYKVKRALADSSPRVRAAAIDIVREKKLYEFEKNVVTLLSDKNGAVRYAAAKCLGAFHENQGIEAQWLYPLLQDSDELVRIETLESLGRIGDKKSLPLIAKRLEDDSSLVRSYAASVIEELNGDQYFQILANRWEIETEEVARVGLAYALFMLGDPTKLSALLVLLSSKKYHVRCAAANSLSVIEFSPEQHQTVRAALLHAQRNALAVADRSTMDRVLKEL